MYVKGYGFKMVMRGCNLKLYLLGILIFSYSVLWWSKLRGLSYVGFRPILRSSESFV